MSGDVGSTPSLTRSGRPRPSLRSSSPRGRTSTAFAVSSAVTAGSDGSLAALPPRPPPWPHAMSDVISEPIPFEPPRVRPRIKKLRVLLVAIPLLLLALVSAVFGMMMAVAADVNSLDTSQVFREAHSSRIVDVRGQPL